MLLGYGHVGSVLQGFVCRSGVLARRVKHFGLRFEAMMPRKLSDPKAEPKRKRSRKGAEEAGSWSLECLSVLQGGTESVLLIDLEAEVEPASFAVAPAAAAASGGEAWGGVAVVMFCFLAAKCFCFISADITCCSAGRWRRGADVSVQKQLIAWHSGLLLR